MKHRKPGEIEEQREAYRSQFQTPWAPNQAAASREAEIRRATIIEVRNRLSKLSEDGPLPMGTAPGLAEAIAWLDAWAKES